MTGSRPSLIVTPGRSVSGDIRVPGDKSISHRALLLGALAEGVTEVSGFLEGEDCHATLAALAAMGIKIDRAAPGRLSIHGRGPSGLAAPAAPLDLGNAGTAMRLLSGLLCGQAFDSTLVGDRSLMRRPMERVAAPLRRMGAAIDTHHGRPPIRIHGGRKLKGCDHALEVASAQVKSAILLAGLQAEGRTSVSEPAPTRDHTERMLRAFGVELEHDGEAVAVRGPARLSACSVEVPGDFSSAAFLIVAGLLAGRDTLRIRGVGINPTRTGLLTLLGLMGAEIRVLEAWDCGGEPVADLEVLPSRLRGIRVPHELVASAIDELPLLFVAAAFAEGETLVSGAAELRVKESDRIAAMAAGLQALGAEAEPLPDGMRIRGGSLRGGVVDSRGDHRVAMSFVVAATSAAAPVRVTDTDNVATSFPGFVKQARAAGIGIEAVP